MDNVIDHKSGRKASATKTKAKEIHKMIVDAMLGIPSRWPSFPSKFHRVIDVSGQSIVYEERDGIVRRTSNDQIEHTIAVYWELLARSRIGLHLGVMTADDAAKTRRLWYARSTALDSLAFPLVTWPSDTRPSYHKMAFDPPPTDTPTPLFDELMGRATNSRALMAWVGSLFDERSQRQQYAWIYGHGSVGKGAFVRALQDVLKSACKTEEAPSGPPGRFWTIGLLGARLVVFADCDQPRFVTSGLFKSLTGEDNIRVEIKGGAVMSLPIPAKYLFTSNERPDISGEKHDLRRVIYCSFADPQERFVGDYEAALGAETPGFIAKCLQVYEEATGGNPRARIESDNHDELDIVTAGDDNEELRAFVEANLAFETDEAGKVMATEKTKKAFVTSGQMRDALIAKGYRLESERKRVRKFMASEYGIVVGKGGELGKQKGYRWVLLDLNRQENGAEE